jgi:hypothetical protein
VTEEQAIRVDEIGAALRQLYRSDLDRGLGRVGVETGNAAELFNERDAVPAVIARFTLGPCSPCRPGSP